MNIEDAYNPHVSASGWDEDWRPLLGQCDDGVRIGRHCLFHAPNKVHLLGRARIDPFFHATCGLIAHDAVHVSSHVYMNGGPGMLVVLKEWSFVGSGSRLVTASDDYSGDFGPIGPAGKNRMDRGDIVFEPFAGVAIGTSVLPGVTLPEGCCIAGHGWAIPFDYDPWSVYACLPGKPPRMLYRRNEAHVREFAKEWSR